MQTIKPIILWHERMKGGEPKHSNFCRDSDLEFMLTRFNKEIFPCFMEIYDFIWQKKIFFR